jgi:hypothetical protein
MRWRFFVYIVILPMQYPAEAVFVTSPGKMMPSTTTLLTRMLKHLAALLCAALLSTNIYAETMMKEPANSSDRQLTEKIIRNLSPCFQTVGVTQAAAHAFPQAAALPPDSELIVVTAMPTTGPKFQTATITHWPCTSRASRYLSNRLVVSVVCKSIRPDTG